MYNPHVLKLIKKIAILLVILLVCDRVAGWMLEALFYKQKHGDDFVSIYLLEKAKENILICGASRASHNFNATMVENGTHMSCFNCGRDEMPVIYTAATLPLAYQRSTPKVIVLELLPTELSLTGNYEEIYQRIAAVLMPFCYKHPQLLSTVGLAKGNELAKIKISHIYPYNSTLASSIQNAFTGLGHVTIKGYEPLAGAIDAQTYKEPIWGDFAAKDLPLDSVSVSALQNVIRLAKEHHTRLITTISPFYFPVDFYKNRSYLAIRKLMSDNQCEVYDFSHDPRFLKVPTLFYDDVHLNDRGAALFTDSVIKIINKDPKDINISL